MCSIAKAEFDSERSNNIFSISIIALLIFGILIAVLGTVFAHQIVPILCSSAQIQPLVYQYYSVYLWGMPLLCYIMSLSYFIRADGIADLPFRALLISNVVNIICDIVFIGALNLGISGAALATIVVYIFGCVYMSTYFFNPKRTLKFALVKAKTFANTLAHIFKSGFSSASTQLYLTIKVFVINNLITLYI